MIEVLLALSLLYNFHSVHQNYTPRQAQERILACTAEAMHLCADTICEGDLGFEGVIAGTGSMIESCFEYQDYIDSRYFDKEVQADEFRCTILDPIKSDSVKEYQKRCEWFHKRADSDARGYLGLDE